jgi:hypothetical protein
MKLRAFKFQFPNPMRHPSATDSGYALLMVLGLMLVMIASSTAVVVAMRTNGRREHEQEMIWRGKQYARAVRLYYHKTGHYPQQLDDLMKGVPSVHFLRQFYKEPMNKGDGTWRLIYINAAGQIIGSVRYASLQQMALMDLIDENGGKLPGVTPGLPGVPASSLGGNGANPQPGLNSTPGSGTSPSSPDSSQSPSPDQFGQSPPPGQSGQNPQSPLQFGQSGTLGQSGGLGQGGTSDITTNPLLLQKPTGPVDGPVLGGFITGVGGNTDGDMASIKVYKHGKKYKEWEFIWNPIEEQAVAAQQQAGAIGGQLPGQIGTSIGPGGLGGGTIGGPGGMNPAQPGSPQQNQNQPQQQ